MADPHGHSDAGGHAGAPHAEAPHAEAHAHGDHHAGILRVYYLNFAALMVLLVLTLVAAAFDLGAANLPIAMVIAVAKAALVVLYFMHVRWSTRLVQVFAGAAFVWLAIMFFLTLSDYMSRGWLKAGD